MKSSLYQKSPSKLGDFRFRVYDVLLAAEFTSTDEGERGSEHC